MRSLIFINTEFLTGEGGLAVCDQRDSAFNLYDDVNELSVRMTTEGVFPTGRLHQSDFSSCDEDPAPHRRVKVRPHSSVTWLNKPESLTTSLAASCFGLCALSDHVTFPPHEMIQCSLLK